MASDVTLRVVDPVSQAVVIEAWIGGGATRDRMHELLRRPPDFVKHGWESWGSISPEEALSIAETHNASGASADDVERWLVRYPTADYWWIVEHDY